MTRGDGLGKKAKYLAVLGQKNTRDGVFAKALVQINAGAITQNGVSGLATSLNISTRHLRRIVKANTGSSPSKLSQAKQLRHAQQLLQKTTLPIIDVAFRCDFASLRQFNDIFKRAFKITPTEMRKNFIASSDTNITV